LVAYLLLEGEHVILVVADDAVREVEAHEGLIDLMNRLGVTIPDVSHHCIRVLVDASQSDTQEKIAMR